MPAFLTHMLGAEHTLAQLKNPRAKEVIQAHKNAYHSGAQGGDYFYLYHYYALTKKASYKMFGYALHRARPQRFFLEGAQVIKQSGSELLKAFFYGYITHYYLDMLVHPAINAICPNPRSTHNTLEYSIDTMYAHENGIDAMEFDRGQFVHDTFVPGEEINHFFEEMHRRLYYGFRLRPHAYTTTYQYFEQYVRKMHKPSEKQMRWIRFQNHFTQLDLLTMLYYPYEQVKDAFDYAPFFDLIAEANRRSVRLIEIVDEYFHEDRDPSVIESTVFNVNCDGVPVVPREERKTFARMYRKVKLKI